MIIVVILVAAAIIAILFWAERRFPSYFPAQNYQSGLLPMRCAKQDGLAAGVI
jgi:hypothetical protein